MNLGQNSKQWRALLKAVKKITGTIKYRVFLDRINIY